MNLLRFIFAECEALYSSLAPEGWARAPYVRFFHPTAEQQYRAYRSWIRRLSRLDGFSPVAEPKRGPEDFEEDDLTNLDGYEEFLNVLGLAVYDIFSDGHRVFDAESRIYSLGSARQSGKFLADFFTYEFESLDRSYDYLDFYMGSVWIKQRADLRPFYRHVFTRLQAQQLDWFYHFPALYLMRFGQSEPRSPSPVGYDPEEALRTELQQAEAEQQQEEFQAQLDQSYQAAWEKARSAPLVPIVGAYRDIYGQIPLGHPARE